MAITALRLVALNSANAARQRRLFRRILLSEREYDSLKLTSPHLDFLFYTRIPAHRPQPSQTQKEGLSVEQTRELIRQRARIPLTLPIRVVCRETVEYQWTEQSRLVDVSHLGAGFTLTRPVEVGRLIRLTIPLPHQLRCFDHTEPMYSVWSLVRHASAIPRALRQKAALFRVGVGFVGKRPPLSYEADPTLRYEPVPVRVGENSMWKLGKRPLPNQRRETRLIIPLEVLVETFDESGNPSLQENTVTETISSLGACIPTSLNVGVGRVLRISSRSDRVSTFAAIRSRKVAPDGIARLGLEFIAERWPLQKD